MQNNDDFSFESLSNVKKAEQEKEKTAHVSVSEKLLEKLINALTPKPFYKRHPVVFGCGLVLLVLLIFASFIPESGSSNVGGDCIAVVRIEGLIMETKPTLEWIRKLATDDSVRGVLLRINSGGGGAAASQEIYTALRELAKHKPMIASMGSTAASGGLMVAMAAEHIVANPSTVTGSIGVRMDIPQLQVIMDKIGIDQLTLKTGEFKDAGDPTRSMTEQEKLYLEGVLEDMHNQFVLLVAEGRKMPAEQVLPIADGRIFTGREAKELGLVDELGGQDAALAILYKQTKVDPSLDLYERPDPDEFWKELSGAVLGLDLGKILNPNPSPAFLFQF